MHGTPGLEPKRRISHAEFVWGLDPATDETGKPIRTYLKAGLVIPHIKDGKIIGLKIRKANPNTGGKYTHVVGSDASPMAWGLGKKTLVVVESELDGILLNQEAGDLAGVVALGSSTMRPDIETDRILKEAGLILVALDSDDAGAKESLAWWKQQYPNARRWPCPDREGPDRSEKSGLDLRAWVMAGLPDEQETRTDHGTRTGRTNNATGSHTSHENGKDIPK